MKQMIAVWTPRKKKGGMKMKWKKKKVSDLSWLKDKVE
jgi:hypothetical protein